MASLTSTSLRRPVATSMFFLIVVMVGVLSFRFLPIDLLPEIEYPQVSVITSYPNTGPEEVESLLTEPIENAVSGVPNMEQVRSSSSEGSSRVTVEFAQDTNLDAAANDLRDALDRLRGSLPDEADQPRLRKFDPNDRPIVRFAVESPRELPELTQILERDIRTRFEQISGVGEIDVRGGVHREIRVNLNRDRLQASNLSATDVHAAISNENIRLPGGDVKDGLANLNVRTDGEYESVEQIANTIVAYENGTPVRVADVAEVVDDYQDISRLTELDNLPVVELDIRKQTGANTVAVAEDLKAEAERINIERSDLQMTVVRDQSTFIQNSIDNVQNAAIWGALLAVLVLYMFFRNVSTTFIIGLSIPISVIATFSLLYFSGLTLNQMTFGGLALGIGLIVDNAIVVLENIVRHREEKGKSLMESAEIGAREVAGAIIASTLTTSVIFLPLVFADISTAALFQALALVVVFALACSLLVALTLVPMLSSRFLTVAPGKAAADAQAADASADGESSDEADGETQSGETQSLFQRYFRAFENWYSEKLRTVVSHRYVVFGVTGAALAGTLVLWPMIPVELAPPTDSDEIDVRLSMAGGTNIAVTMEYLEELEGNVREVLPMDDVENVAKSVRPWGADVEVRMVSSDERSVDIDELADEIRREVTGSIPGGQIRVRASTGLWILRRVFSSGGGDESIELELRGNDLDQAERLGREIARRMETVEGIAEARADEEEGQPEQNLRFDRDKIASLGLSVQDVAQAVQTNVGGLQAGQFRDGGDEHPITVRLRPEDRFSTQDLDNIAVRTPDGENLPISNLVESSRERGPTGINRVDGQRVTYVYATLESGAALGDAVEGARAEIGEMSLPDDFSVVFGGEYQEQQEAQNLFYFAVIVALLLTYMVMAGQFERFMDPLVVMFSVPVAIVGIVPTLLITGTSLNIQSIMGIIMLIGIVVNNAIVLVDYINIMRRDREMELMDAVVEAGRLRLRPILITALTTILALFPLALGIGAGAEMQAALARVVIGGLAASTLITLVLIPAVYVTATRASARIRRWMPEFIRPKADPSVQAAQA